MPLHPRLLLLAASLALLSGCPPAKELPQDSAEEETDDHWPSPDSCKVQRTEPGWKGCTQISTTEGCWQDSDGVVPTEAGCHTRHTGADEACAACEAAVLERLGESCTEFTDPVSGTTYRWLVETNPDAGVCHPHPGGKGHPDVFDCDAYCQGTGYDGGTCEEVTDMDCDGEAQRSARCACWREG